MASAAKDDSGIYHLTVGTEVSAKYRGAFCEAQIKSLKKSLVYKVLGKKTGKCFHLSEDNIKGVLKIGAVVEAQVPDQILWQEGTIQSVKDRSSYTVVFDDGDERTLSRGSLCLKGDRHYAKSETLDNLPLTDPENFGTPVLGSKKNRRRRPVDEEFDDESEGHKTPERESPKSKEKRQLSVQEVETSSEDDEDDDEKRTRWLADPLMGKVVIVEPYDKRKHWFPGVVVNPLCYERHKDLSDGFLVVRSFKTGKFLRVDRESLKEMSNSTIPLKLDNVWKGIVEDAQRWQKMRTVSDRWRIDIKEILDDSEDGEDEDEKSYCETKKKKKEDKTFSSESEDDGEKEEVEKKNDFLEVLYKFMDDCGTPINKTPVLGYKDLNLYLLFKLVQKRQGSASIDSIKEWKQIYLDLGIPKPNPAAGHNVRTAYLKYLGAYEEYCASWKHLPLLKKSASTKSPLVAGNKEKKKFKYDKSSKAAQDGRKIKVKENMKNRDAIVESKLKGRSSPLSGLPSMDSPAVGQQRRSYQRRRISESSSASDVTLPPSNSKAEKKKPLKGSQPKKVDEKFRSPGGPDSEPDENSCSMKAEKKETGEKRHAPKLNAESAAAKRIRRNSTSAVSTQYSIGDKLKVKYGQGKTFKLYDAKVLQVKLPEGPGESIEYLVHYAGWNARHDEWIRPVRIVGFAEDKGSVPLSPVAGTTKSARRPRTPVSSRTSASKDEIIPSPESSYSMSSRFSTSIDDDIPDVKDDLPDLTIKPQRVPSLLKKNLVGDFMKSLSSSTMTTSIKRSTSPVLVSSQRTKRPKTPPPPKSAEPTPIPQLETQIKQEPLAPKVETEPPTEKQDKSNERKVKQEEETPAEDEKVIPPSPKVEPIPDVKEKLEPEERERSISPSEESLPSSVGEVPDDSVNEQRAGTPLQQVRRTSRRSKSPAYLIESSWFATKRKKYSNVSVEKSPSPSPTSDKKGNMPKHESVDAAPPATADAPRTSSPTPSSQSSTSSSPSSSEANLQSEESSPVLSNLPKMTKTRMQSRKKIQDKIESGSTQQDKKITQDNEKQKPENTEGTEYDNFDDEAPSIALEKHHEMENSTPVPTKEIVEETAEGDKPYPLTDAKESTPEVKAEAPTKSDKTTRKKSEVSEKTTGRKIRKRKLTTEIVPIEKTQTKVSDTPETTKVEGDKPPVQQDNDTDDAKVEDPNEKSTSGETLQFQGGNKDESSETENTSETTASSNYDNPAEASHILSPPENPPSSSKVLIENTPPTTPEQSPNYISEDQDIDHEKSSPNLFSNVMDIVGEEHKDSAGNTSSSGCEQTAPLDKHNEKQEVEGKKDKEVCSPPAKKKRRDMTRKASTSKSRGRHSSYTNDQDSESEDDRDNETGETATLKRRESTGRVKPRKKRTKARPEPPSAPPPLPLEELESMSQDDRIALLQTRMAEMRKVYHQLKQEIANIDRKRKRAKRREKEAGEAAQSSSKRGSSPFAVGKFANTASIKAEVTLAPLASGVTGGHDGTEGDAKSEDGR